ncbi:MAG: hypothetical protein IJ711_09740 [Lachnospiraceae bacterium]|nr:hypothetical protein [Lachnospiraceae bacterium]
MAFFLFFGIFSRILDSFQVTRVSVTAPSEDKIAYEIYAAGSVEADREFATLTHAGIVVGTVYVREGDRVSEGQPLFDLSMESIEEQMTLLEDEILILEYQEKAQEEALAKAQEQRRREAERAGWDAAFDKEAADAGIERAKRNLQKAKEQLEDYIEETERGKSVIKEETIAEDESADQADAGQRLGGETNEGQMSAGEMAENGTEGIVTSDGETEEDQTLQQLQDAVEQAQQTYEDAVRTARQVQMESQRKLEDASLGETNNYEREISAISRKEKQQTLSELMQLKEAHGVVVSPGEGIVTELAVRTGQRTTDTAAVTMADAASGFAFRAQIGKEDAEHIRVGDHAVLESTGKKLEDAEVASLQPDHDNVQMVDVTIRLPKETFTMGESVSMKIVKYSKRYPLVIPLTALHTENEKAYVLVMQEEETVLGGQYFAKRIDVEVIEKNERSAAVREGLLTAEDKVIADSDSYVEAGARVRLWKQ